jgi:hypothetical protein
MLMMFIAASIDPAVLPLCVGKIRGKWKNGK